MRTRVTVAIPVYGALEQTKRCLQAVAETTHAVSGVDVLVIDDATPEPGFSAQLSSEVSRRGFRHLKNERNLGFVGTCNRVFDEVETGHVLLLNSDTQPAGDWLELMLKAVDVGVGSVMPTSNNATIYSVPHFGFRQFTPDLAVGDMAAIVASVGWQQPIEIPVSVGFCMLITRAALDRVGGFDPVFGRGYGEEEDWCMRALRVGFIHRLVPSAFVFHEGGVSMSAAGVLEKGETTHVGNAAILDRRYPDRRRLVSEFLSEPTMEALRGDVKRAMLDHLRSARPRIVHWLHADPSSSQAGGTERVVRTIVEELANEYYQAVVFPGKDGALHVEQRANGLLSTTRIDTEIEEGDDPGPIWRRVASEVLQIEQADLMHFHHGYQTGGAAPALGAIEAGVPLVMSIHDFNLICPRNHLLDRWGAFCGVPASTGVCNACVPQNPVPMAVWRGRAEAALQGAAVVIVGDSSILELFGRAIELPQSGKVVVLAPGKAAAEVTAVDRGGKRLVGRVLIPGRTEAAHKGRLIIGELVRRLVAHGVEVHSIGTDEFEEMEGFVVHGEYRPDELEGLLQLIDPDLAILPTVVPESFSILLTELWKAGLPVLAFNTGAVAARISRTGGGFLVESATAGDFADAAMRILGDPDRLDVARGLSVEASAIEGRGSGDLLQEHRRIYAELISENRRRAAGKAL